MWLYLPVLLASALDVAPDSSSDLAAAWMPGAREGLDDVRTTKRSGLALSVRARAQFVSSEGRARAAYAVVVSLHFDDLRARE